MLKILVLDGQNSTVTELVQNLQAIPTVEVLGVVTPGIEALNALEKYQANCMVSSLELAQELNQAFIKQNKQSRLTISASTHQGVQLVPVDQIYYFQAADKYVTAYHSQGELLIEDSIASLESEFEHQFIRIHRKTLVSKTKIKQLNKAQDGKYFIQLIGQDVELAVSRRQLATVRRALLCT